MGSLDLGKAKPVGVEAQPAAPDGFEKEMGQVSVNSTGAKVKSHDLLESLNLPKEKFIGNSKKKTVIGLKNVGATLFERKSAEMGFGGDPDGGNMPVIKTTDPPSEITMPALTLTALPGTVPPEDPQESLMGYQVDMFRHYAGKYWTYDAANNVITNTHGYTQPISTTSDNPPADASDPLPLPKMVNFLNPHMGEQPHIQLSSPFSSIKQVATAYLGLDTVLELKQNAMVSPFPPPPQATASESYAMAGILDNHYKRSWSAIINGKYGDEVFSGGQFGILQAGVPFIDCAFDLAIPFDADNIINFESKKNSFIKLDPEYNYYARKYEEVIAHDFVSENVLPSVQVISALHEGAPVHNFKNFAALMNSNIFNMESDALFDAALFDPKKIGGDFFTKLAENYASVFTATSVLADESVDWVQKHFVATANEHLLKPYNALTKEWKNIIVPYADMDLLNNPDDKKRFFPMHFKLQFSTDINTEFTDTLQSVPFGMQLLSNIIGDVVTGPFATMPYVDVSEVAFTKNTDLGTPAGIEKRLSSKPVQYKYWNLNEWIETSGFFEWKYGSPNYEVYTKLKDSAENFSFLSRGYNKDKYLAELDDLHGLDDPYGFDQIIYSMAFLAKYNKFIFQKKRSFKEILEGKKAYSETVMYRIVKTRLNATGDKAADHQNIWIPNTNMLEIVDFIDTQVKYNTEYKYQVFAYQLVIGNRYSYVILPVALLNKFTESYGMEYAIMQDADAFPMLYPEDLSPASEAAKYANKTVVGVNDEPFIKLVEVPYGEVKGKITDHPPIPPEVDLIPYAGINNRLLINLNGGIGEHKAPPIFIEPEDPIVMQADVDPNTGLVHFKSDDSISNSGHFEVFRIDRMPFSYADFRGAKIANAKTSINSKASFGAASSAGFLDTTIQPNKKYWYMFRTVDLHGNISNPSPVFQIEIVDDRQSIYFLNEVFEFPEKMTNLKSTTMKKYIQITPAYLQSIMKSPGTDDQKKSTEILENAKLGIRDQSLWGKRFKIRFISRQTGRKFDLHVDFQLTKNNKTEKYTQDVYSLTDPNK